ncbi:MAG: carboxyltransferase domain-containing protein [Gemmatimonadaceae bacterium]|nr:carboxyltransferase domain-containing protein [Gloeobacterales cyanobacterium ES-bin-141]
MERWQDRWTATLTRTRSIPAAGPSFMSSFSTDLGAFPDEAEPSSMSSFMTDVGADSLDEVESWMAEEDATAQSREIALDGAVLSQIPANGDRVAVTYRLCGDKYLLIEYGPMVLDLNLHFRVHALRGWLEEHPLPGLLELTPGVRSLQVHYDSRILALEILLATLATAEAELPPVDAIEVRSRIVHLPLAWEDPSTLLAIEKYMQGVNPNAPWCPSNIEFIRRINGLDSIEQVREIVFSASYLVLGLGDVYLGAPVATPLDPRHRLVTTKYNPARTWTPENAVGIGGAYMCIYGMEGPGGYQFVGRTLQVWNRFRETTDFQPDKPWLLRFFDQIRFYPVTGAELLRLREAFLHGQFQLQIEEETFNLRQYNAFLNSIAGEAAEFKARQQTAFEAERDRWAVTKALDIPDLVDELDAEAVPPGSRGETAPVPASVWQIQVQVGDVVKEGDPLVVLESMKMEITVAASMGGVVVAILCARGQTVAAGQNLVAIRPEEA